ncbi:MAG: hypothetical protein SGBAC_000916 [Bacillariaceae sp.]
MSVVGVDIGLQNSVIAAAGRGGVDVVLNGNSQRLNPTMVCFDQARKMGEAAGVGAASAFKNTIKNMKRLVGLPFDDPRAKKEMEKAPFECVPMKHSLGGPDSIAVKVSVDGEDKIIPVENVCGMIIHHMGMIAAKKAAETSGMGDAPDLTSFFPQDWVVAIPSYYTDSQRRALLHGCEVVGIPGVQRLMHENTATALAYGIFKDIRKEFEKEKPTNVMFIDIGASQYTVTIVSFEPGKLIVKSSCFDEDLGGRDFDFAIADWLANKFVEKYSKKLSSTPQKKPKVMLKLLAAAEKAKKTLSPKGVKEASINLECLMEDLDFNIMLKAADYEAMSKPLVDKLEAPIVKALADAQMNSKDLSSIEIVGGCTRIGFVKTKLMEILKVKTISTTMNADEAIARGAALQSAILSPRFKVLPYEILDSNPLPIKLSWDETAAVEGEDGAPTNSVTMFDRGLSFPIVRRVTLRRTGDFSVKCAYDQAAFDHGLVEGVSTDVAQWSIKVPPGEEKKIRVNVKEDIHGIISLSSAQMVEDIEEEDGEEAKEGEEKKKKVKKTNLEYKCAQAMDWTKDEINNFREVEVAMANQDRIVSETADMRNDLESYIYNMRDKITSESQLANYGTQAEKDAFDKKQMEVDNWLYEDGYDATKSVYAAKLAELKKIGGPIEARATEAEGRPGAVAAIQGNIEKYKNWLSSAQGNDKYAHITDEDFDKCHKACDSTSSWVYDMLDKQGSLGQDVDPAFTIADLNAKSQELTNVVGPIMHKPAPKPKKEEKPKEEKPAEGENMDVDESVEDGGKMDTEE